MFCQAKNKKVIKTFDNITGLLKWKRYLPSYLEILCLLVVDWSSLGQLNLGRSAKKKKKKTCEIIY